MKELKEMFCMNNKILVQAKCGDIIGNISERFIEFKGIPYARAVRFGRPKPVYWNKPKECTAFGKKAMQVIDIGGPWAKPQKREEFDEDCLNLNIYIPAGQWNISDKEGLGTKALPVLVEIHGGAFQNGSNQEHTAEQMIRGNNFIYVSLNYRLGIFGFLYMDYPDVKTGSANLGLMDLMAGIRWVYENISAFGGDPERITLMGSSAGAKAIGALMCTPELKKYVHQLILSSGGTQSIRDKKTAKIITAKYMEILSSVTGRHCKDFSELYTLPADTLIEAQKILCDNPGNTCMFGPVADGEFIPENWQEIAVSGTLWEGRAMVGSSFHELAFHKMMNPDFSRKAEEIAGFLLGKNVSCARAAFDVYCQDYARSHGGDISEVLASDAWERILTDYMYRTYSYRLARRLSGKGCQVWQYSVAFLPALHCFDQQLAFLPPMPVFFNGKEHMEKAEALGRKIYAAFVRFIENGNPSSKDCMWPGLTSKAMAQMVWDEDCRLCPVRSGDVLEEIGESVFVL